MPELHVGLNMEERFDNPPTIEGVPVSVGGMVLRTRKGDTNKAIFVTSWEEFERKCGSFYGGFVGPKHVRGFFVNEGRSLWLSRVLRPEVFATLTTDSGTSEIVWTARHPGAEGNSIRIKLTDPGGASQPLGVTVTPTVGGYDIDVSLATDGGSAIISTAAQVVAAVNAHLTALQLVVASGTGAGVVTAQGPTNLASGSGPATSDSWEFDSDQGSHSVKIAARNPGAWGNALEYTTLKASTTLAAAASGASTEVQVNSIRDFEIGDLAIIEEGANLQWFVIWQIDTVNKKLKFKSKSLASYTTAAVVKTATTHACSTVITSALASGATQATLNNASGARVGSLIHITDGTTDVNVLVTQVSGNVIFFAAITLGAPIPANSPATSFEFDLTVQDDVGAFETHPQLSMEPTNALNYVNTRLSGKANKSELVEVLDQNPSNSPAFLNLPFPVQNVALAFGLDGETPQDSDYIGVSTPGSETGIYRFNGIREVSMIATPGVTSKLVVENGIDYCDARLHAMYIASVPQSVDTVEEAIEWRDYTINISSMRGTLYFPWITILDPESEYTLEQDHSPEGWVMGVWSRVAADRGTHKAPANERIKGLAGLVTDDKTVDWDDASLLLNPRGVNIIRNFPGFGIRIFGARTLLVESRPQQFIHVMRTTIFVEESVLGDSIWIPFEPNNDDLSEDVYDMIQGFLYDLWKDGVFVPEDNSDQAFYVYTGSGINPQAQRQGGIFKVKMGFNVVGTAEKVLFTVTNMRGQRSIEEQ